MIILVTGGNSSGKSKIAEDISCRLCGDRKLYIATMKPFGDEAAVRIGRHKEMRAEKNFDTVEVYNSDFSAVNGGNSLIMLECVSNLVANAMFAEGREDVGASQLCASILTLKDKTKDLVLVSGSLNLAGVGYGVETVDYINLLSETNRALACAADVVIEAVCGVPNFYKGALWY